MSIKTIIENGKFLIPKGYYQIFGDTIIQEGDLWIDPDNEYKDEWLNSYILKKNNRTVAGEQFKEPSIVYIRKIEDPKKVRNGRIPDGWIKINSTEVLKEGDYFYFQNSGWSELNDWRTNDKYRYNNNHIRQIHQSYIIFSNKEIENKDSNINNQNMNNNIEELKAQKAKIEQQIKEAESQQREEMNNLVAGDYIVCLNNNCENYVSKDRIYKVDNIVDTEIKFVNNFGREDSWSSNNFRKATPAEIEQHLRNEAAKNGFVVGARVSWNNGTEWQIDQIEFYNNREDITHRSCAYVSDKYVLVARTMQGYNAEICKKLILVEDNVLINGYKAEYFDHYIKFGCARVCIVMLRQLKDMYNYDGWGNQKLEGKIMIGKGEFDKESIEKLLDNHKKKFGQ